jgi:hypothetical protein
LYYYNRVKLMPHSLVDKTIDALENFQNHSKDKKQIQTADKIFGTPDAKTYFFPLKQILVD